MTAPGVTTPVGGPEGDAHADITSHDTYVAGVPHATFARLRRDDPVSWWDETEGSGFWAVTRYDDVLAVSRDHETFTVTKGIRLEEMDAEETESRRTMMEMDPPEHTRYRRLVSKPFSRREVFAYESAIRGLARLVIDHVVATGQTTFDFVDAVAKQLPMRMLGRLLGVPDEDGPWLVERGDALLGNTDPEFTSHPVDLVDTDAFRLLPFRSPAGIDLFRYAEDQARERRAHPTDDVISHLLAPMVDGDHLTDQEFDNFFTLLVAAGNDTTRYTMAQGIQVLMEHPDQLAALRDGRAAMDGAVEEILRWGTVTMHFRRTATRATELAGRRISAADKVVLWFISADYDEGHFPDPYRFDITRTPNEHVAFGRLSPHLCLGAQLARLELKVLYEELLPRLADLRPAGPVERLRSNFISGIKRLPISVAWA
jgi:cytochrome P450